MFLGCWVDNSDELLRIIPFTLTETLCNDVCIFIGRPYAVNRIGQTIMVRSDLRVHLVAESMFDRSRKFLVENEGELLLLDNYLHSKSFSLYNNEVGCEKVQCLMCSGSRRRKRNRWH